MWPAAFLVESPVPRFGISAKAELVLQVDSGMVLLKNRLSIPLDRFRMVKWFPERNAQKANLFAVSVAVMIWRNDIYVGTYLYGWGWREILHARTYLARWEATPSRSVELRTLRSPKMVSAMSAKRAAWLLPPGASVALTYRAYPNPAIYLYSSKSASYCCSLRDAVRQTSKSMSSSPASIPFLFSKSATQPSTPHFLKFRHQGWCMRRFS
jgi:hypothetical protein